MKVLVVGAGFAGAVYARTLAERGHEVAVIDRRDHIGGNAFDAVDACGVRVHRYGPHLFHTSNEGVVDWLKRFGTFVPYVHSVTVAWADGYLPMPISRATFESYYGRAFPSQEAFAAFLQDVRRPVESPRNAAEHLYGLVGRDLTDLLFRPYTKKMWGQDLEDVDASVVQRISINDGYETRYFPNDRFQVLPEAGYTAVFAAIFDHPNIRVTLGTPFEASHMKGFDHTFSAAAIDEHYDYALGELPYRSIKFHHHRLDLADPGSAAPTSVVNYSDAGPFTRETRWHMLPAHHVARTGAAIRTVEEPCDFLDNDRERYYPIKDPAGRNEQRYQDYRTRAAREPALTFIGRCGTYRYLDMHQVINQSLQGAQRWLAEHA